MRGCWWALVGLIAHSFITNIYLLSRPEPEPTERVDTLWRDTTIREPAPPAETIRTDRVVYLRVPAPSRTDTLTVHDSIQVPIPIEQKRYEDSLYTAWVSGFRPALDSIRLHQPEIVTTITETIVKKAPRLSVGLSVGPGVSIDKDHHMGIYVGFTANYRLWPK